MLFYLFLILASNYIIKSNPIYYNDLNYVQSQQISIYNSQTTLQPPLITTILFLQAFSSLPQVGVGIIEFDINIPNNNASYNILTTSTSYSSISVKVDADASTQIYSISICVMAITIPDVTINSMDIISLGPNLNNADIQIPFTSPQYVLIGYYHKGLTLDTTSIATVNLTDSIDPISNNFVIEIRTYSQSNLRFLQLQYLIITQAEINSRFFISSYGFSPMDMYNYILPITDFSLAAGKGDGIVSTFFGINDFYFDLTQPTLQFKTYIIPQQITLQNIQSDLTFIDIFFIHFAMGKCPPNLMIAYSPQLYCCSLLCFTCVSDFCGSCDPLLHRYLNVTDIVTSGGDCLCLPGYIQINQICQPCDGNCYQCSLIPSNCTSCGLGYVLFGKKCVLFCIINYYQGINNCSTCPKGCQTCQNSTACTTFKCISSIFYNNSCVQSCGLGTFYESNFNRCVDCDQSCAKCDNLTICQQCHPNFFMNTSLHLCFNCYPGCVTCANSSNDACYSCSQMYYLNSSKCILKTTCGLAMFQVNNACFNCMSNCQVCSNSTQCRKCINSYIYFNNSCVYCNNIPGLKISNNECIQICGDGYRINQECDDGNNLNNDGCNFQCKLQNGYFCQGNRLSPDICWKKSEAFSEQVSKSLISNQLEILFIQHTSIHSLTNISTGIIIFDDNTFTYSYKFIHKNEHTGIVISYNQDLLDHQCNISLSNNLNFNVHIGTQPRSYYYSPTELIRCQFISQVLKYLSISSLLIVLSTHLISNQFANTVFLQTIQIYIFSLFNYKYISPIVYNCILELKYFLLLENLDVKNLFQQRFTQNYIFDIASNKFSYLASNIFIVYCIFSFLILLLALSFNCISKKVQKLYQKNVKQYKLFLYHTFCLYSPALLFNVLMNITNSLDAVSIILALLSIILLIMSIIFFAYYAFQKNNYLVKHRGLQKVRNYLFIFMIWLSKNRCFSMYVFVVSVGCLFKAISQKKKNLPLKHKLIKYQQIYNEVFLLMNSIFIYIIFQFIQNNYKAQLILGWFNIFNLIFCLAFNSCILIVLFGNKVYQIYFNKIKSAPPIKKKSSSISTFDLIDSRLANQDINTSKQDNETSAKGVDGKNEDSLYNIQFYYPE